MTILQSKLQVPKRYKTLRRNRLIRLFDDICQKKMIAVTAGAGYGKTTLVMDALTHQDVVPIWYRLDEEDTDLPVFISYLYSAVHLHFSESSEIEPALPKTGFKNHRAILNEFLAFAEKTITRQTAIVLDDYHLVQGSEQINDAVGFLLSRLPSNIHLVLIGRKNLDLKVSSLRVKEQLVEISENDLSFTDKEIKHFFSASEFLTDAQIKNIHLTTGGWVASLVLLRYALNKKIPEMVSGNTDLFNRTPEYVFSYLKETIFDTQPGYIKDFMMKCALLGEIDIQQCRRIFKVDNAETIINQMIEDHLMIFPVDDSGNVFYLHHLFRDFLLSQIEKKVSPSEIRELHCRIARHLEGDDIFQALNHFIDGHEFGEVVEIIKTHEMKFLMEGKINFLRKCLGKIPEPIIEENPQLLLAQSKIHTYFGNPRQAMEPLTRAHLLFKKQDSKEDMVKCLVELASQYYFTGYVREAKLLIEQVLDDVEKPSATYLIAMTYLTFLSSALGEFETADKYYKMAWEVIEGLPGFERSTYNALINTSYTYTLYVKGEFERAQQVNKKLLKSVLELQIDPCLPLVYYQLSATSYFLGTHEKGLEFGRKGIEICEKISLADSRKGWVYLAWAQNCLGLGQFDRAIELIDNSIELFEEPGNRWGLANAWDCLHQVYLAQGRLGPAKQILTRAVDIIEGYGLRLTEGILGNSRARLLMGEKDFSTALVYLENAREKLNGAAFHLFSNHLLTVRSFFESTIIDEAVNHLLKALSLAETNVYDGFVIKENQWLIPFFLEHLSENRALETKSRIYLERILKPDLEKQPPDLNIVLLGQFSMTMGKQNIPLCKWKSSKALMILKYLAANRNQGFIPREALIEMLWPDQDPEKTGSRFNMAMSALRKTLEPDLSPKAPSAYIQRKKDRYRLFNDTRITVDIEQFSMAFVLAEKEKTSPLKKLSRYLETQSIYQGVFLEEDRYEDWCIQKREQLAADYLNLLKSILEIYEEKEDFENAIFYAGKIIELEPFDESITKRLMIFYGRSGNLSKIKKTYLNHEKIAGEMDCSVSPEIKALYHNLIPASE